MQEKTMTSFGADGGAVCRKHLLITISLLFASSVCSQECNIADEKRTDCGWKGIVEGTCKARDDCCWSPSSASGFPYCFYNSNISAILKTAVACELDPPVRLNCNIRKRISIHDVFYGRNDGDDSCHNGGGITCFNPNATEIVRNICKNNSTCVVSPKGDFWNFDSTCDDLNAQLKIHYICVARASSITSTAVIQPTSRYHQSTSIETLSQKSSNVASTRIGHRSSVMKKSISQQIQLSSSPEIKIASSQQIQLSSSPEIKITSSKRVVSSRDVSTNCANNDLKSLSLQVKRKDNIITGLTAALSIMCLAMIMFLFLSFRNKIACIKVKEKRMDVKGQTEMSEQNCYDVMDLQNENPYYEST